MQAASGSIATQPGGMTLRHAVRSQPETERRPMALGYTFRLELAGGTPAAPAFRSATLNWKAGERSRWARC